MKRGFFGFIMRPPKFGHRCTLVWPPPVRLFAQPTNVREASRLHPAGDVDAYVHTHAHADQLWGPQYKTKETSLHLKPDVHELQCQPHTTHTPSSVLALHIFLGPNYTSDYRESLDAQTIETPYDLRVTSQTYDTEYVVCHRSFSHPPLFLSLIHI